MLITSHRPAVSSRRGSVGNARGAFPTGWRLGRACALAFLAGTSTGCYSYVPIQTSAATSGMQVSLDVNDRGRVMLADSLGPAVSRIEGSVQSRADSGYVLNVSAVEYISGQRNRWSGEPLGVRDEQVGLARERRFSKLRTAVAVAVSVGAVLAIALTRDLLGSGTIGREPPDPGPGSDQ